MYHVKSFLIISNFLKIEKAIVSNWYQNLDESWKEIWTGLKRLLLKGSTNECNNNNVKILYGNSIIWEEIQMKYWEVDNEKVNEFNFLNKEVEEFMSRWTQSLVNVRSTSYLKQRSFEFCLWDINRLYIQFFIWTWVMNI